MPARTAYAADATAVARSALPSLTVNPGNAHVALDGSLSDCNITMSLRCLGKQIPLWIIAVVAIEMILTVSIIIL